MWTSDFHAEATSPCIDAGGGDCDLIPSALEIFSVESARVNVSEDGAFRHTGAARDLTRREVLFDCGKREDDVDQLGAGFTGNRTLNLLATLT